MGKALTGLCADSKFSGILEQEQQLPVADWGGYEPELDIKTGSLFVKRMGQQGAHTGLIGDDQSSSDGVLQQPNADTLTLMPGVHGEARQQYYGDWVLPHAFADAVGRIDSIHLPDGQAGVADDLLFRHDHERPGRAAALRLARVVN